MTERLARIELFGQSRALAETFSRGAAKGLAIDEGAVKTADLDQIFRSAHVRGEGLSVAIIDTGVNLIPQVSFEAIERINLTDAADEDLVGHGTFVAALLSQKLPGARLLSIKAIGGKTPAASKADVDREIEWVRKAFEEAFRRRCQFVCISAGVTRPVPDDGKIFNAPFNTRDGVCDCDICQTVEAGIRDTGACVVAAGGNKSYASFGATYWTCPAYAHGVVRAHGELDEAPVGEFDPDEALNVAPADIRISVPSQKRDFFSLGKNDRTEWVDDFGSSFSAPRILGLAAQLYELFGPEHPSDIFAANKRDPSPTTQLTSHMFRPKPFLFGMTKEAFSARYVTPYDHADTWMRTFLLSIDHPLRVMARRIDAGDRKAIFPAYKLVRFKYDMLKSLLVADEAVLRAVLDLLLILLVDRDRDAFFPYSADARLVIAKAREKQSIELSRMKEYDLRFSFYQRLAAFPNFEQALKDVLATHKVDELLYLF